MNVALGCMSCSRTPVVQGEEWVSVIEKWLELNNGKTA